MVVDSSCRRVKLFPQSRTLSTLERWDMPSFAGRPHDDDYDVYDGYDEDGDNVFIHAIIRMLASSRWWCIWWPTWWTTSTRRIGPHGEMLMCRHNSMYAASTRSMASPLHQPPYKLQDVSGASEVGMAWCILMAFVVFLLFVLFVGDFLVWSWFDGFLGFNKLSSRCDQ